jgi:hypothetical protein
MGQGYTKGIPLDSDGTLALNSDFLIPTQKAVKTYVDTGLATKQPTLTGDESVLLPTRLLLKQNTTISHTGTTSPTIVINRLINAGTINLNDLLRYYLYVSCTNNANVKSLKCYFNTTNDLSGSPILVATRTLTSVGFTPIIRNIWMKNSLTSQETSGVNANTVNDEASGNVSISTLNVNFSVNQYFIVLLDMVNAGDTINIHAFKFEISR